MGGDSGSSLSVGSGGEAAMGSQRELINIRSAQLFLVDGEESALMQSGEFSLKLLKQTHSPLAVVVANVGEVQWPVGKDAPVLKVWTRRYTFALPGLVYGLIFSERTPVAALLQLETILAEYCTYEVCQEIASSAQQHMESSGGKDVAGYWTAVAPDVETRSSRVARQICSTSTIVADSIVQGGEWAALGIQQGGSMLKRKDPDSPVGEKTVSPRMMKRMQQARRMSAVAKLMSKTLLKGAISATGHVSRTLGIDVNATTTSSSQIIEESVPRDVAVASVDAFGKVVEAVETAGKSIYGVTSSVGTDIVQQRFGPQAGQVLQDGLGAVGNVINTAWTLNKVGVRMLLQVTAASTAINLRSGPRSSPGSGTSGDDQSMSSATSAASTSRFPLFHQITLSPPGANEPAIPSERQTSQLFPTSAEQMRMQTIIPPAASATLMNPLVPSGNYTSSLPPGLRPSSSAFHQPQSSNVPQTQPPSFTFPFTNPDQQPRSS